MNTAEKRQPVPVEEGLEYYPPVETHLIRSEYVQQTFKVQVMQPLRKRGENARLPVIYATDGNRVFEMFKGISEVIQASGYDAPRFILVTIGYPSDSPRAGIILRARDFTFTGYPKFDLSLPPVEGVLAAEPGAKDYYGAEDFQNFIEHELVKFIDDRYSTQSGERTYFGHSGGGGFGLFTLFTRSSLFNRYIVSSASMQFHGKVGGVHYENCDFLFQQARKFIESAKPLTGATLYMSVGSEEEFEPGLECWQITSSFYRMAQLLKAAAIPGLELKTEVFHGETHMTVWPMAFIHGIQAVFNTGIRVRRKNRAK